MYSTFIKIILNLFRSHDNNIPVKNSDCAIKISFKLKRCIIFGQGRSWQGIALEREHLHPYTLDQVLKDKRHGKEQIYTGTKDLDCARINQNRYKRDRM